MPYGIRYNRRFKSNITPIGNDLMRGQRALGTGVTPPSYTGNQTQDLLNSLDYDINQQQAAANADRGDLSAQAARFQGIVEGTPAAFDAVPTEADRRLAGLADDAGALRSDLMGNIERDGNRLVQGAQRDFGAATRSASRYASGAVGAAEGAVRGYQQDQSALSSATVSGLERRAMSQLQEINSGMRPDGTRMTVQEQMAAKRQLQADVGQQVASTVAEIQSRANSELAGLRMQLSKTKLDAGQLVAGVELEAARGTAAARESAAGMELDAAKIGAHLIELQSGIGQFLTGVFEAAQASKVKAAVEGNMALYQMIADNPRSVISYFQGLMALYASKGQSVPSQAAPRGGGGSGPRQFGAPLRMPDQAPPWSRPQGTPSAGATRLPSPPDNFVREMPPVAFNPGNFVEAGR